MRWVVRIARALIRVAAAVVGVRVGVWLLGPWPAAVVMTAGVVVGGMWGWATVVEPRLFVSRVPYTPPVRDGIDRSRGGVDHVAFAQALSVVADAYLNECQRQAGPVDEDGFA